MAEVGITGSDAAHEAPSGSEAQFHALANAIPQLAWMTDADGWIYWYNRRWYEYTGTTPDQMEGWGWEGVHDPAMLPAVLEQWKRSIATGEPFEMVFPLRGADGLFRRFLTRAHPLKDADGRVVRWFGTNTDVDALKQAEARQAADLDALTRLHALSARMLEAEGLAPILREVTEAAVAMVGAQYGTLQLLEDGSLKIAAHHGHQPSFLEYFANAEQLASVCGETLARGERVVVPDVETSELFAGTPSLPVLRAAGVRAVQSTPMVNRTGKVVGILSTQWDKPHRPDERNLWRIDLLARQAADLIDTTRAKDALRESKERLEGLIRSTTDAVITIDADQRIVLFNPAAERMFACPSADAIGGTIDRFIPAAARQAHRHHVEKFGITGVTSRRMGALGTLSAVRATGEEFPIEASISQVTVGDRTLYTAIVRDITERKQAEETQRLLLREMNHRVKNLFALVDGMIALSSRSARTPQEMARSLRGRLHALVRAHDLVRPEAMDTEQTPSERTTIDALVCTVLLPHAGSDQAHKRILTSGPDVLVGARAATSLALTLHESATNAAKYGALSDPNGSIRIEWCTRGDSFHLQWEETGGPAIVVPPPTRGFGSVLAERSIVDQLGGQIDRDWRRAGLILRIAIPLERLDV